MAHPRKLPISPPFPDLKLFPVISSTLQSNIDCHIIQQPNESIIVLHLILHCGDWYAPKPGIAELMAQMLLKGTEERSAANIATSIEFYGASVRAKATKDVIKISLVTPASHFETLLPLFMEMVLTPTFPPEELDKLKKIEAQKIQQRAANPQQFCAQKWYQEIFGAHHPYGYFWDLNTLNSITQENIRKHYERYAWHKCVIFLGGPVDEQVMPLVAKAFEQIPQITHQHRPLYSNETKSAVAIFRKPKSLQTAICVGHKTILQSHVDYIPLYITNRLLGGFFGSYLMRNLREEKGYTYGVFSHIQPLLHHSAWYIATAVDRAYTEQAYAEIVKEIDRLRDTLVTPTMLKILKNYLIGQLLISFDGLFPMMHKLVDVVLQGLTLDYYQELLHSIKHLTPITIQKMAQKYFMPKKLCQVMVGDIVSGV